MSTGWEDLIDGFQFALTKAIEAKCAIAIAGLGGAVPVAAVLAIAMHNHGMIGKGNSMGDPSPRQVSLYARDLKIAGHKIIHRRDGYYIRI